MLPEWAIMQAVESSLQDSETLPAHRRARVQPHDPRYGRRTALFAVLLVLAGLSFFAFAYAAAASAEALRVEPAEMFAMRPGDAWNVAHPFRITETQAYTFRGRGLRERWEGWPQLRYVWLDHRGRIVVTFDGVRVVNRSRQWALFVDWSN